MIEPSADRGHLLTEQTNPSSENLDQLSTDALISLFVEEKDRKSVV